MKKLLFFAALLLAVLPATAANVNVTMAQKTAQRFLQTSVSNSRLSGTVTDLKLIHTEVNSSRPDIPVYYIFNSNRGFIIVSGEDRAQSVLAYGERPLDMKKLPDNMKFWLSTYKRQLEYLQSHPGLVVDNSLTRDRSLRATTVAPLLTAEWDQSAPYNNQCVFNNTTCLTGCPATSLSMVFYYWKYPTDPTPAVEGYTNTAQGYSFNIPALPSITFDWDNMLDKYTGSYSTAQGNAVAWLMRYIGQEEQMEYSPSGSGAMGEDILRAVKFFGYDEETAQLVFKSTSDDNGNETELINDADWAVMLQNELAEGRPVVYCAYDYSSWYGWSGHAFNVDGYNASTNVYHVNWGWSGEGNGDFALNAFSNGGYTFNIEQQMIMGIQPPMMGAGIKVNPANVDMKAYVGKTATATFTVTGQELNGNVTLTLNDANGVFSLDANSVTPAEAQSGKTITVTYQPQASGSHTATVTLSSNGVEDKTVTLNGVSTLETYVPTMLPADSAFINLTQFRAEWTDMTPADNVESYTLEVGTRPAVELLDSLDGSIYSGSYENISLSLPWSSSGAVAGNDAIYFNNYDNNGYIAYTVPEGYTDATFSIQITTSFTNYGSGNLTVASSQTAALGHKFNSGETYTWVVTASEGENIYITSTDNYYSPDMSMIKVYAGDVNELNMMRAVVENGDTDYRLITGITNNSYLVKGLAEAGTFYYKVKAVYTDGTESKWSNSKSVTLFENGHSYDVGDANHDGIIDVTDVTMMIDYMLGSDNGICASCSDMDGNMTIDITDVTLLLDYLSNN